MANIELVIKIPEEVYKLFKKDQKEKYVSAMIPTAIIANSTPLPQQHGALIDRDKLSENIVAARYELPSEYDDGLHEAWEVLNEETVTPVLVKSTEKS